MTKYRIRLPGGRVIGPFTKQQLFELKAKGHIKGNEEAQVFPTGSWGPLSGLDVYSELMDENRTFIQNSDEDKTFAINLDELRSKRAEKEIEQHDVTSHAPLEPMTETMRIPSAIQPKPVEIEIELDSEPMLQIDDLPDGIDDSKTLINPVAQQEIEKMRKLLRAEEEKKKVQEAEQKRLMALEKQTADEEAKKLSSIKAGPDELTMAVKIDQIKKEILAEAKVEEKLIEKQKSAFEKKKRKEEEERNAEDDDKESVEVAATAERSKKIRLISIIGGLAILYALFFPEDEAKKPTPYQHLAPQIIFPIPFDKADKALGRVEFDKGIQSLNGGTYPEMVKAGLHFKAAYENDLSNQAAMNLLVRTYAEELGYSKNTLEDATTIFSMIQSKRPYLIQDANGVIGLNLFYTSIGKHAAAADVIARYLKLNPKNFTQELFAVYLESLMKIGNVDKAREFYTALSKAQDKNQYALEALINYSLLNQETETALAFTEEAIKKYPKLVRFYLKKAEILLPQKKFKEVEALLEEASKRNLEYNDKTRAKFLEISGIYYAIQGKVAEATKMLTTSLGLVDSNELRMKLADLSPSSTSSPDVEKLIKESQAMKFLYQAKDFYDKKSLEPALSAAAHAVDLMPDHIPSGLFLSKVQLRLGLTRQGLKTLEDLVQKYPDNKSVNLALIEAYTESYKFKNAQTRISVISATEIRNTWEYSSVNAKLFLKMGDTTRAIGWLNSSIRQNPLNDHDIFILAEILLKRSNFDAVRNLLNKCMELDPVNPDYRIAYAKMIYETQDDQAAIGYLLGIQNDFGENPKFLSEVAIFYFRSGKVKDFLDYKKKLEDLPVKDKALYEFLIRAALLDERYKEIPDLVEKLIAIEPGDLESMMTAGRVLFESNQLKEAALWFRRVMDRLPSYPKVQYYLARIKFLLGDYDDALKEVQKDIEDNGESDTSMVFMGEIYVRKGELVTAENFYKKAQKINAKSYEALVGLADISTLRNNYDLALDLYKRAAKERSDEPVIHRKIGDVYRLLGQGTLAIESYKMYLEMDPEAGDKKKILDYIQLMQ